MKQTFSKVDAESAKTFFSHVRSNGVRSIKILSHFLSTVDVLKWGYFLGMSPDLFITKKAQTTFSCSLLLCCSFRIFFSRGFVTKKPPIWLKSKWARHPWWQLPQKKASFLCGASSKRLFQKEPIFLKSPCMLYSNSTYKGSKLPMVNNHGVANNLIVIFFTF